MSLTQQNKPYDFSLKEEYFTNDINIDIYTRTWEPVNVKPLANLLFVHGHGEHIGRYDHVFSEFVKAGIKVHAFDQVGCGKTGEKQNDLGGAMGLSRVLLEINDALVRLNTEDIPLFLMGHSFGGASILNYLAMGDKRDIIHGAIANAPCINVHAKSIPPYPLRVVINSVGPMFPKVKVDASLDTNDLSRVKEVAEAYKKDPLVFSRSSLIQVRDVLFEGQKLLKERFSKITIPRLLIAHGTEDHIACFKATQELSDKIKQAGKVTDLKFVAYEGGYHEIQNDTIQDKVISDHIQWVLDHLQK